MPRNAVGKQVPGAQDPFLLQEKEDRAQGDLATIEEMALPRPDQFAPQGKLETAQTERKLLCGRR